MIVMTPALYRALDNHYSDAFKALKDKRNFITFIILMIINGVFWVGALGWLIYRIHYN